MGDYIVCEHIIPDGHENVLNSAITHHENILRELRRNRKLVIKAKQANKII